MLRLLIALLFVSFASAFFKTQSRVVSTTRVFGDVFQQHEDCPSKLKDAMGRCPGHAGYIPQPCKEDPKSNFASFQAAQKLKKEQAAAKAKGK